MTQAAGLTSGSDLERFSAEELAARLSAVRGMMRAEGLDVVLIYGAGRSGEIEYLTEWPGSRESHLLVPLDAEPKLFVQLFNHAPQAARLSVVPTAWGGPDSALTLAQHIQGAGAGESTLGVVGALPFNHYLRLREALPGLQVRDASRPWRTLRSVKSAAEIDRFRVAAEYTDRAMDALYAALEPGITEHQLAAAIEHAYRPEGGTVGIHFMASMPMDAPTTGVPAQVQTDRPLCPGDVLITEISAGCGAYTGQIHRTYFLGREPTDPWRRLHDVAVETYERIESVLHDGATLEDVLDAAEIVHQRGFTIFDDLLHGANQYPPILKTRRTAHSNPREFTFSENMVVVIQPNVTTDLVPSMGLQFGETIRITRTGAERLHRIPRQYFVKSI